MAALTYPNSVIPQRRLRLVAPCEDGPVEFDELPRIGRERTGTEHKTEHKVVSIKAARQRRMILARRRRLAALAVSSLVLVATWGLTDALASLGSSHLVKLASSVPAASGYLYTVQAGDTVWSIASRLDPGANPVPIVDQIESHLVGTTLVPGEHILVP